MLALQSFPIKGTQFAERVDLLYSCINWISAFFILLMIALVTYFVLRYRRRSEKEIPEEIHGNLALEITWTIIPFFIVMWLFVWGVRLYIDYAVPPKDAMEILVTGKQWMWKVQHPNGKREINDLHIPIGKPVKLTMTSEDVIHDMFIPAFRVKIDVVPGRYTQLWFEAKEPGEHHLFCAEYCGTEHSLMKGTVYAMTQEDYQKWLDGSAVSEGMTPVEAGEAVFNQMGCMACHNDTTSSLGAKLDGIFGSTETMTDGSKVKVDEEYLRESILQSTAKVVEGFQPIMPSYEGQLSEEQIMQLIQYIKSLTPEAK